MFKVKACENFKPQYPPAGVFEDLKFSQQRRDWALWTRTI